LTDHQIKRENLTRPEEENSTQTPPAPENEKIR